MQSRLGFLIAILLLILTPVVAQASTFVAKDAVDLVAESSAVVHGRVVSVDSFWNPEHTLIVSEAVVEVEEAIVGEAPRFITVRTAGGTVADLTVEAVGFPSFVEGREVLLFLSPDDENPLGHVSVKGKHQGYRVTGYAQGHYDIFIKQSGEAIAVPTLTGNASLVSPDGRKVDPPRARPLESFAAELRFVGEHLRRPVAQH